MCTCCGDAVCSRQGAHHCSCETAACVDKYFTYTYHVHDIHRHSCEIRVCVHTPAKPVCTQVTTPPAVRSRVCMRPALPDPVLASAHTLLCARKCTHPVVACARALCSCVQRHRRPAYCARMCMYGRGCVRGGFRVVCTHVYGVAYMSMYMCLCADLYGRGYVHVHGVL